jgi:hypothetical protein
MQTYDKAEVMFGGVAIGTAYNLNLAEPVPIEVARPEPPPPFTVTAECRLTDADRFFADVRRLMPTAPSGVVTLSLPWGILGTIKMTAYVDGVTHAQKAGERATTSLLGQVDEREMRRTIANAVRIAILDWRERVRVATRALMENVQRPMAAAYIGAGAMCRSAYRGERKQRKAMRRLLRAAGITRPAT